MKYETKSKMKYNEEEAWFPLSEDLLSWDRDFHILMLNDHIRMVNYEAAIKESVKPGMVVLDLGTGTGILAKWALEAGAKKVYGIELNEKIIPIAIKIINDAGFSDKFQIFQDLSYSVDLPEKVDIIISEILGNLSDNEDMVPILEDARKRFLKKDGIMLPKMVETFIVPIACDKAHSQIKNKICKCINEIYDLDCLLVKLGIRNPFNLYYDIVLPKSSYLSEPQPVRREFKFEGNDGSEYQTKRLFRVKKSGLFTGFKGYFVAQLSENVFLDISGDDIDKRKTSDCWKHCYLPIENPFEVKVGDQIEIIYARRYPKNRSSHFRQYYSWKGCVKRKGKILHEFSQDMGEDLDSCNSDYRKLKKAEYKKYFDIVRNHIENTYKVEVSIEDLPEGIEGDLNGAEIKVDKDVDIEEALFISLQKVLPESFPSSDNLLERSLAKTSAVPALTLQEVHL